MLLKAKAHASQMGEGRAHFGWSHRLGLVRNLDMVKGSDLVPFSPSALRLNHACFDDLFIKVLHLFLSLLMRERVLAGRTARWKCATGPVILPSPYVIVKFTVTTPNLLL